MTYTLPLETKKISSFKYHLPVCRGNGEICATLKELKMQKWSSYPKNQDSGELQQTTNNIATLQQLYHMWYLCQSRLTCLLVGEATDSAQAFFSIPVRKEHHKQFAYIWKGQDHPSAFSVLGCDNTSVPVITDSENSMAMQALKEQHFDTEHQ